MTAFARRILAVEDDVAHAELVRRAFLPFADDYQLTVAGSLTAAREELADRTPDLVIADLVLPDGRGIELLPPPDERPSFPMIVMTSFGNEQVAVEAIKAGAFDYIVKSPTTLKDLPRISERVLREWSHIVERRQAEDALRESEERYRTLVEQATDGIFITDPEGYYVDVNTSGCLMLGYSREEVLGLHICDIVAGEDRPRVRAETSRLRQDSPVMSQWLMQRKDGFTFFGEVTAKLLPDHRILGILRDVSERKEAEAALRRAEEKYRHIFENAVEGIFQSTPDGRLLTANPALARILGYGTPDMLLANVTDVRKQLYVDSQERPEIYRLLDEKGSIAGFECQLYRRDGSIIWVSENAHAVRDAAGGLLYYEGTVLDVTERKHLEEQLRQFQRMEAIGQLAGGVAHDFNNILTVINGHATLLLENAPDAATADSLQEIAAAGDRAAALTRQLLLFSRKQALSSEVLDLNEALQNSAKMLRRLMGENLELELELGTDLPSIKADPSMVDQVVLNLTLNARDAMPKGGAIHVQTDLVTVASDEAQSNPEAYPGTFVRLSVDDAGPGIPPDVLPHIFEPFFTTKEPGKGTGLGLATVFGIVKQHQGWIDVESSAGRGTVFQIYWPVCSPEERVAPGTRSSTRRLRGGNETILLVEDEDSVRLMAASALKQLGYRVLEARSGAEALEAWESQGTRTALLLTDLVMPGSLSGFEVAEKLRAKNPNLAVIYTSGYAAGARGKAEPQENSCFLAKPYPLRTLAEVVRRTLDAASTPS